MISLFAVDPQLIARERLRYRMAIARAHWIVPDAPDLTLRALEVYDPAVLWGWLKRLDQLPEPAGATSRSEELSRERAKMRGRVKRARAAGKVHLVALAERHFREARERLMSVPRTLRGGTAKASARRRRVAVRELHEGLSGWTTIDIARLVLESQRAWQHPPCPLLVERYSDGDVALDAELADVFMKDRTR